MTGYLLEFLLEHLCILCTSENTVCLVSVIHTGLSRNLKEANHCFRKYFTFPLQTILQLKYFGFYFKMEAEDII